MLIVFSLLLSSFLYVRSFAGVWQAARFRLALQTHVRRRLTTALIALSADDHLAWPLGSVLHVSFCLCVRRDNIGVCQRSDSVLGQSATRSVFVLSDRWSWFRYSSGSRAVRVLPFGLVAMLLAVPCAIVAYSPALHAVRQHRPLGTPPATAASPASGARFGGARVAGGSSSDDDDLCNSRDVDPLLGGGTSSSDRTCGVASAAAL